MTAPTAVVLLSGGMDSAVTVAVARSEGYAVHALSFDYGQRHRVELTAARRTGSALGVARHHLVDVDLTQFGGSALTDPGIQVPRHDDASEIGDGIPVTYVPARNTIFLSYALALAETTGARNIFIGVNVQDRGGYPDCRPEYLAAFERMAGLATAAGAVTIHAPLAGMSKTEIIQWGLELGVDFSLTHSCYDPAAAVPCGRCDACLLRAAAFAELSLRDGAL